MNIKEFNAKVLELFYKLDNNVHAELLVTVIEFEEDDVHTPKEVSVACTGCVRCALDTLETFAESNDVQHLGENEPIKVH